MALVPCHNEADGIAETIESLLNQERKLDQIVIIADNCTDDTEIIASRYPVTVLRTEANTHKKSGALNTAWRQYAKDADVVVCADGDTRLPPYAVGDWVEELALDVKDQPYRIGGISGQVVMVGDNMLERMQRAEFAKSAQTVLRAGTTHVISGTGCCFAGAALRDVASIMPERAPWSYASITEDFYLTHRLLEKGWRTIMSRSVPAFTGAMPTLKALWHQRIKWHVGTIQDLLVFGVNRLTWTDWLKQLYGLILILFWVLYPTAIYLTAKLGTFHVTWQALAIPFFFSITEAWQARKVYDCSWKDIVLAASLIPTYLYAGLTIGLLLKSWWTLLVKLAVGDLWAKQYKAEGVDRS